MHRDSRIPNALISQVRSSVQKKEDMAAATGPRTGGHGCCYGTTYTEGMAAATGTVFVGWRQVKRDNEANHNNRATTKNVSATATAAPPPPAIMETGSVQRARPA
jgi:hypothetical protein